MSGDEDQRYKELLTLKTIAETLNQSNDMKQMLQTTLEKLLELTHLKTGWIFLVDDEPDFEHMADHNLPPALSRENKKPMRCDDCLCLRMYWAGELNQAINIIECERLCNAVSKCWGDTHNLTHHATIPITIRGEHLGLLNVGSPGKEHFSEGELAFLQAVAYQIGTAVERTRLYEAREKEAVDSIARYIVNYYANANEVTRCIWKINDWNKLLAAVVEQIGKHFGWPSVAIVMKQDKQLVMRSLYHNGVTELKNEVLPLQHRWKTRDVIRKAFRQQKVRQSKGEYRVLPGPGNHPYSVAFPLKVHEIHLEYSTVGILYIGRETEAFSGLEIEILGVLADHISLVMEKIRLYEEWQDLLLAEERNRLARDLHDSVNQKLFSLSMLARGVWEMTKHEQSETADAIQDIGELAQESLTEMRSLIWQLRPYSEVKGMLGFLKDYAEKIGVRLTFHRNDAPPLTKKIEEALVRIGQEALNNVRKHAGTNRAWIGIEREGNEMRMKISDQGQGFAPDQAVNRERSLGITSMKERASEINGSLSISSEEGMGTIITVNVPLPAIYDKARDEQGASTVE